MKEKVIKCMELKMNSQIIEEKIDKVLDVFDDVEVVLSLTVLSKVTGILLKHLAKDARNKKTEWFYKDYLRSTKFLKKKNDENFDKAIVALKINGRRPK